MSVELLISRYAFGFALATILIAAVSPTRADEPVAVPPPAKPAEQPFVVRPATHAEEPAHSACQPGKLSGPCLQLEPIVLRVGIAATFTLDRDFKTGIPGDQKVVEILPVTDRKVIL